MHQWVRNPERALVLVLAVALGGSARAASPVVGSPNTATAVPGIARPSGPACEVQLFSNVRFADFSPKAFDYTPACRGPWSKVVLAADFSVEAGRQFDRTATIWVGGANLYFGTTAEPSRKVARNWHVERDLTEYAPLFTAAQPGRVELGNLVNSTYTASLFGSAKLQFYRDESDEGREGDGADGGRTSRPADLVLPLSAGPTGGTVGLDTSDSLLARTFTLPTNVERAVVDVIAQSQGNDEFWYTCVPDDVANVLLSCGSTAFRETQVAIDGVPAGVAPVYPWIYTGGIDPYLWRPIPGVQTLNFTPYRVDLTPFAGVLSDGNPHQISLRVQGANSSFSVTGTLLVFVDAGSVRVTGAVTENTIGAPAPSVSENLTTAANGTVSGSILTRSTRHFRVAGWVKTSRGEVRTAIEQDIDFSNAQQLVVSDQNTLLSTYVQNIVQRTRIDSRTTTSRHGRSGVVSTQFDWPLRLDYSQPVDAAGIASERELVQQRYDRRDSITRGDELVFSSILSDFVAPTDTLVFNGPAAGAQADQASSEKYFAADSEGACYSREVDAAKGVVTAVVDGADCGGAEGGE